MRYNIKHIVFCIALCSGIRVKQINTIGNKGNKACTNSYNLCYPINKLLAKVVAVMSISYTLALVSTDY